jgi:hypothetical protein
LSAASGGAVLQESINSTLDAATITDAQIAESNRHSEALLADFEVVSNRMGQAFHFR